MTTAQAARNLFAGRHPRVIGHRGTAGTAPENTIASFRQAVEDGADLLEFDIRLTSDHRIVVIHDATVDRTTDGTGTVSALPLDELKALDAGFKYTRDGESFSFRGQGITIPTFAEVLEAFSNVPLIVEIKDDNPAIIPEMVRILRQYGRLEDGSVLCAGFKHGMLKRVRRLAPNLATSFSIPEVVIFALRARLPVVCRRNRRDKYIFQSRVKRGRLKVITPRAVRRLQALGYEVHVWTINDENEMHRLLNMGVDAIITDFPGVARRLIEARR
jgi:glycerophosphoryl diester phosphodiesterase